LASLLNASSTSLGFDSSGLRSVRIGASPGMAPGRNRSCYRT
jgi:hypothetical protein